MCELESVRVIARYPVTMEQYIALIVEFYAIARDRLGVVASFGVVGTRDTTSSPNRGCRIGDKRHVFGFRVTPLQAEHGHRTPPEEYSRNGVPPATAPSYARSSDRLRF